MRSTTFSNEETINTIERSFNRGVSETSVHEESISFPNLQLQSLTSPLDLHEGKRMRQDSSPAFPIQPEIIQLPRWDVTLFGSASSFELSSGNRVVSRRDLNNKQRAMLGTDVNFEKEGIHHLVIRVKLCPIDHLNDPLELGVLARLPGGGGFRGVGYATEGQIRGGGIFQDGTRIMDGPALSLGSTFSIELTIAPGIRQVCFQVNGETIGGAINLDGALLPIVPVVTVPSGSELEIVQFHPRSSSHLERKEVPAPNLDSKRVCIWDRIAKKIVTGNEAPKPNNLSTYLLKYPNCEIYNGQDKRVYCKNLPLHEAENSTIQQNYSDLLELTCQPENVSAIHDLEVGKVVSTMVAAVCLSSECEIQSPDIASFVSQTTNERKRRQRDQISPNNEQSSLEGSSYDEDNDDGDIKDKLHSGREVLAVGTVVLVAGRGPGTVVKCLANRWRRVRLADGSEMSFKKKDLLQVEGISLGSFAPISPQIQHETRRGNEMPIPCPVVAPMSEDDSTSEDHTSWICCDKCNK